MQPKIGEKQTELFTVSSQDENPHKCPCKGEQTEQPATPSQNEKPHKRQRKKTKKHVNASTPAQIPGASELSLSTVQPPVEGLKSAVMMVPPEIEDVGSSDMAKEQISSPSQNNLEVEPLIAVTGEQPEGEQDTGIVLITIQTGEEEEWNTEEDGACSSSESTSLTPDFKRGRHAPVPLADVIQAIKHDAGKQLMKGDRKRGPSLQLLADARVAEWPVNDNICIVNHHPKWTFKQWIAAIRVEVVHIECETVVIYLEMTQEFDQAPPLKNGLQSLCKAIHSHHREAHIFVANTLPQIHHSPVKHLRADSNYVLLQAIRSVNRVLKKIHYLSVYEHFVSKDGRINKPTHKFIKEDSDLTTYGCMIFRECLMHEAGLKKYWF